MPQTRGLKTPDIHPPTGVKARSPRSRCPRAVPLRGSREVPSCVFQPLRPQVSLGCGHTLQSLPGLRPCVSVSVSIFPLIRTQSYWPRPHHDLILTRASVQVRPHAQMLGHDFNTSFLGDAVQLTGKRVCERGLSKDLERTFPPAGRPPHAWCASGTSCPRTVTCSHLLCPQLLAGCSWLSSRRSQQVVPGSSSGVHRAAEWR